MPSSTALANNTNQLCIIEGDYQITKRNLSDLRELILKKSDAKNLIPNNKNQISEFIDLYMSNLSDHDSKPLNVIYSKDGAEVLNHLLNNYGLASLVEAATAITARTDQKTTATIHHFNTTSNLAASSSSIHNSSSSSAHFICFIINDFDQNDQIFLKLEEIQLKINNLLNLKSTTSTNNNLAANVSTTSLISHHQAAHNNHKRFIIFGWPVLYHCLRNEIVR
jgi:hypothetical protein